MSGLSTILSFQTPLPQGQLHEMLKWTEPVFDTSSGIKTAKIHDFKNITIGSLCPDSILSDPSGMVWIAFCGQLFSSPNTLQDILTRYLEV